MQPSDDFAGRLLRAMYTVAREAGLASAYPDTREGKLAALQARLRTLESSREWGNDVQRSLVLQELRRLRRA
jgi:hypothetical protein